MKITIFGFAGSGTSTIGKMLSKKLEHDFMSSGNIMRTWSDELGYTIYEFEDKVIKNDNSFDIKLDNKVELYGKQNNDFVFESRLAWNFIPDSFKIYLECDNNERYSRIHKREGSDLGGIILKTKKREDELINRYKQVYSHITFPPEKDIFDLVINASDILPEQIVDIIISKLK